VTLSEHFFHLQGPILDCCWHDDGTKVFMASCDKQVNIFRWISDRRGIAFIGMIDLTLSWITPILSSSSQTGTGQRVSTCGHGMSSICLSCCMQLVEKGGERLGVCALDRR
jgi:hypothetical protein